MVLCLQDAYILWRTMVVKQSFTLCGVSNLFSISMDTSVYYCSMLGTTWCQIHEDIQ